jgi:4-aminobutyrate aminotransferase
MPGGSLGGTYAGNVVSCAAANAVLDVFESEDILSLSSSASTSHLVAEVRGQGLMLAVEFNDASDPICQLHLEGKTVPKDIAGRVQKKCFEQGLMVLTTSIYPVRPFPFKPHHLVLSI